MTTKYKSSVLGTLKGVCWKVSVGLELVEASQPVALLLATRWRQRHVSASPPAGLGIRLLGSQLQPSFLVPFLSL